MSNVQAQSGTSDDLIEVIDESSLAYKIFTAFVTDSEISATEEELREFAAKELKMNLSALQSDIIESLPLILVAFMNMWSGWHFKNEFRAGKFRKEHYFNRFKKFMTHKMKSIGSQKGVKDACADAASYRYKSAMKSTGRPAGFAPQGQHDFSNYAISIQCPPHMLNTIVFSNSGDDVIMKQHLGSTWRDLSTTQLVNWPHMEVSFRSQDICFVRKQATEFMRYLNFLPHEWLKNCDQVIEHAETLAVYGRQKECYSLRLLQAYAKEYLEALKSIKQIKPSKFEEIQIILTQFLEDVKFINVNSSMATNTVIIFKLSPIPFIRNKKLVKNNEKELDEARVGYCEIITPKIELVMIYFRAIQQEVGPQVNFEFTEKIWKKSQQTFLSESELNSIMPYISYKCTFCRVEYDTEDGKKLMLDHLRTEHKMEQHVRCTVCKKQFDVVNLATCRWRHKCTALNLALLQQATKNN